MKKMQEIVRLRLSGRASVRQIAAACGVGRSTVSDYLARIETAGLKWPEAQDLSESELRSLLFPADPGPADSQRIPDWNQVRQELTRKGVTLKLLWDEYRLQGPNAYSYSRFARLYRGWLKSSELVMLQRHVAGEKLFVDWTGMKLAITDPKTGKVWNASVFVSAMGASQYVYAKAYEDEKSERWLMAHVEAFEFYGSVPAIVVPDNLKTGVDKPCRYEPDINQAYAELARHYELLVLPARVRKPKDKAKVENAVQQVERWVLAPLRGRTFFSLAEANLALLAELTRLNNKTMRGPGRSRKELFEKEDLPAMRPLPQLRYSFAQWKRVRLGPDYHVEVEGHRYSAPFNLVSEPLDVRFSHATVELFHHGKRVASHLRSLSRMGFTTLESHMPERHKAQASWTPERFYQWAQRIGPNALEFTQKLLDTKLHPEHAYRSLLGTLRLEKQFGAERLDAACQRAVSRGALSSKSVKSILDRGLDAAPAAPELPPLPMHDNIRGGDFYAKGDHACAN